MVSWHSVWEFRVTCSTVEQKQGGADGLHFVKKASATLNADVRSNENGSPKGVCMGSPRDWWNTTSQALIQKVDVEVGEGEVINVDAHVQLDEERPDDVRIYSATFYSSMLPKEPAERRAFLTLGNDDVKSVSIQATRGILESQTCECPSLRPPTPPRNLDLKKKGAVPVTLCITDPEVPEVLSISPLRKRARTLTAPIGGLVRRLSNSIEMKK